MNYKRKSRRRFFLLMRSRTPSISSEFRGGGFEPPKPPPSVRHWLLVMRKTRNCRLPMSPVWVMFIVVASSPSDVKFSPCPACVVMTSCNLARKRVGMKQTLTNGKPQEVIDTHTHTHTHTQSNPVITASVYATPPL